MTKIGKILVIFILLIVLSVFLYFILKEDKVVVPISPVVSTQTNPAELYLAGRNCYEYNHVATTESPYTVKEKIDITRDGVNILGNKSGTQSGPDMTNAYNGTLVGSLEGDLFSPLFVYTIDGSAQKEKEIYQIVDGALVKRRYTLKEENKVLVPDMSTKYNELIYLQVSCAVL